MESERADLSDDRLNEAATDVLVAEFEYLSGMIQFYRRVELTALAGTGGVISAVVIALTALEAAESPKREAEGILLAVGAWAPAFLLLVENMALTRLRRVSLYIACDLQPLARELTRRHDVLNWEWGPAARLLENTRPRLRPFVAMFASSTPLVATIGCTSVAFAVSGAVIDGTTLNLAVGGIAAVLSIILALYGIVFSWTHEQRVRNANEPGEAPRTPSNPKARSG